MRRSEEEVRKKLDEMILARKKYLQKMDHGTKFSRKYYHYIKACRWFLGEVENLGES